MKFNRISPMLKTKDIEATIKFYTKTLGFRITNLHPEKNPEICFVSHGNIELMFYVDTEATDPDPVLTGQLYVYTDGVMELYDQIKDKVVVLWGPDVYWYGMREFAIREINGYTLTFGEPTTDTPIIPSQ